MNIETSNVEIRSKKARNIIGQIPKHLTYIGTAILSTILIILISTLIFYKHEFTIKTSTSFIPNSDSTVIIKVNIPANQIERINSEQLIIISFDNIPYMFGNSIQLKTKDNLSQTIDIKSTGGYYTLDFIKKNPISYNNHLFYINDTLTLDTEINTGKKRLISKHQNP